MTKTQIREALKAVRDLRRKYQGKKQLTKYTGIKGLDESSRCPLCLLNRTFKAPGDLCFCPWLWFEEKDCAAGGYSFQSTIERLERIDRWEGLLNDMLAGKISSEVKD